jgi:hypothetical protein
VQTAAKRLGAGIRLDRPVREHGSDTLASPTEQGRASAQPTGTRKKAACVLCGVVPRGVERLRALAGAAHGLEPLGHCATPCVCRHGCYTHRRPASARDARRPADSARRAKVSAQGVTERPEGVPPPMGVSLTHGETGLRARGTSWICIPPRSQSPISGCLLPLGRAAKPDSEGRATGAQRDL